MVVIDKESVFKRYLNKHKRKHPECPVCGKTIYTDDLEESEYIKTKRGSELFVHTKCVKKWGESS